MKSSTSVSTEQRRTNHLLYVKAFKFFIIEIIRLNPFLDARITNGFPEMGDHSNIGGE